MWGRELQLLSRPYKYGRRTLGLDYSTASKLTVAYISFDCPHLDSMPEYHLARPVILKPTRTNTALSLDYSKAPPLPSNP